MGLVSIKTGNLEKITVLFALIHFRRQLFVPLNLVHAMVRHRVPFQTNGASEG